MEDAISMLLTGRLIKGEWEITQKERYPRVYVSSHFSFLPGRFLEGSDYSRNPF